MLQHAAQHREHPVLFPRLCAIHGIYMFSFFLSTASGHTNLPVSYPHLKVPCDVPAARYDIFPPYFPTIFMSLKHHGISDCACSVLGGCCFFAYLTFYTPFAAHFHPRERLSSFMFEFCSQTEKKQLKLQKKQNLFHLLVCQHLHV